MCTLYKCPKIFFLLELTMLSRLFIGLAFLALTYGADNWIYRTCSELDYCTRLREKEPSVNFASDFSNINTTLSGAKVELLNLENGDSVILNITVIEHHILRITLEEDESPRFKVPFVLEPITHGEAATTVEDDILTINFLDEYTLQVSQTNLSITVFRRGIPLISLNRGGRLTIENSNSSRAFAFDALFHDAIKAYGIPEHADVLALRDTIDNNIDPYRLFNEDVPSYDTNSTMSLYGSIPLLYGHGLNFTTGIFLLNSAEEWIDISYSDEGTTAYYMVETGSLELYLLLGPTPEAVVRQYANLTGVSPLPQFWSLGYHTCRWNYLDQEDVKYVIATMDLNDFPIDVIWGDVDTQDYHRYFTWEPETFSDPVEMLNNLSSTNRMFATHIDPHYKVDDGYFVYAEGKDNGYFVKNEDGSDFIGECWPGNSSWIDFFNPAAIDWYAGLFAYDRFNGSTPTLGGIWNDMNEPAVFDDDTEKTMIRTAIFYGGISHREVHNMYGFTQSRATFRGLIERDNGTQRPFILSRSFFAGSQRYAAVWTGDSAAEWRYLRATYPMCLSINIAGVPYCGTDMGGFYDNPTTELLVRWYQSGTWLPFFRAHAAVGTERREPYLYDNVTQSHLRTTMKLRYAHLPVWYTLFYEHFITGSPIIRPLFFNYPNDRNVLDIDDQLLVGNNIMVRAVMQPAVSAVNTYLPGGIDELWYDIQDQLLYFGGGIANIRVTLDRIPVFYRGGSIIFRRDTERRNTYEMRQDSYNVYIFLNNNGSAVGRLYFDDYESFNYLNDDYSYLQLTYAQDGIAVSPVNPDVPFDEGAFIVENYYVYRPPSNNIRFEDGPQHVEPIVITHTIDGTPLKDVRYSATQRTVLKLF